MEDLNIKDKAKLYKISRGRASETMSHILIAEAEKYIAIKKSED